VHAPSIALVGEQQRNGTVLRDSIWIIYFYFWTLLWARALSKDRFWQHDGKDNRQDGGATAVEQLFTGRIFIYSYVHNLYLLVPLHIRFC
jgi:hypothetical protein